MNKSQGDSMRCFSFISIFVVSLALGVCQAPAQQYAFTNYAGQPGTPGVTV